MQIQFLGTGDAFCSGGRNQTSFLVDTTAYRFLIDCGATTLMALNVKGIESNTIDGIIISHFHGDHFGGLPFLFLEANHLRNRSKPLSILGPPGIESKVGELLDRMYPTANMDEFSFKVEFKEYSKTGQTRLGPMSVEAFPVIHVPESLPHGIRISVDNKILSFSGDTGWTDNLYSICDKADLFICECNFFRTLSPSHLNYQTIVNKMDKFNCKRIILNHLGQEMLENLNRVELECSYDGLMLNL